MDYDYYISEYDYLKNDDNLGKLSLFYEGIHEYAKDNFIYPKTIDICDLSYHFKYATEGYRIGFDKDKVCICKKVRNYNDFIDFEDIKNNKPQVNTKLYKQKLEELQILISELGILGIPAKAINDTYEDIYEKIKLWEDAVKVKRRTL